MFPDELRGSTGPLVALGAISMVGRAALATKVQREQALRQLKQRTSAVPHRLRRAAGEVAQGVVPLLPASGSSFQMSAMKSKMCKLLHVGDRAHTGLALGRLWLLILHGDAVCLVKLWHSSQFIQ